MATVDDKKIIFSMVGVSKTITQNQKQVLKNIYLSFFYGAKIGIIGLNGSGKTTLMKIIAGLEQPSQGEVVWSPGYSVGYLEQEPYLDDEKTVLEVVKEGVQNVVDALNEYNAINDKFGLPEYYENEDKMNELFARQGELQDILDATDAWNLDSRLERAMDALRCPPADQKCGVLSGGERRRVALCRLLLQKPDVLLLDEPTNHLDAESIDWLEQHLQQYEGTVICVTHDRYFLDDVAGWILELDRGEGIPWQGNYSSWLDQKTKRMAQEEKVASKRRKTLERELEWVRMAPKARQAKGKARLKSYESMLNQEQREREEKLEIFIPNGPRLGNKVIEAHGLCKAYGDKTLIKDLDFMLPPNGIVGVIGPNGAGKTTTLNLISGLYTCDTGKVFLGDEDVTNVTAYNRARKGLARTFQTPRFLTRSTIAENMKLGTDLADQMGFLNSFFGKKGVNFMDEVDELMEIAELKVDWNEDISSLAYGQMKRLEIIRGLLSHPKVMLVDEPAAGLNSKELEKSVALIRHAAKKGVAIVLIEHKMDMIMNVCDHITVLNFGKMIAYGTPDEVSSNEEVITAYLGRK